VTANNIEAALQLASTALDGGDSQAATGLYQGILREAPDNHEACLMLGSLYGEAGRLSEAVELLQKAMKLNPDDAAAGLVLTRIFRATGEPHRAIELLELLSGTVMDAEVTYTLAAFEEEAGNRGYAQQLYERAITQAPEDDTGAWLAMASFRMNVGDFDGAEEAYNEVLKRDPGNSLATGFLSVALAQLERTDEAESLLREALKNHPDEPDLHHYLAHTLKLQGMNAEALESCERAIALAPEDRRHVIKKAEILESMGDLEQAFDLMRPILASDDIPVEAALVFARLSHPLGMVDDGKTLLQKLAEQPLPPLQRQNVADTLQWLESV